MKEENGNVSRQASNVFKKKIQKLRTIFSAQRINLPCFSLSSYGKHGVREAHGTQLCIASLFPAYLRHSAIGGLCVSRLPSRV